MTRNIRLLIEYDGTNYHGWQSQAGSGRQTIQDTLERALRNLTGQEIKTGASGRTDAGVHALGQVANLKTESSIPEAAWAPALNHLLPPDIRVLNSREVPLDFHARYSAISKMYRYRILCRRQPTALDRHRAWHINLPLEVERMRQAAGHLVGRHDFSSFRASGCTASSPVRTIMSIQVTTFGEFIDLELEADAFLQHMVRNIVGTLVEVGLGRFSPPDVLRILDRRNRSLAGKTAPSQGLYLVKVTYPE